ncbi:MAG: CYTH domain-containing protein [Patescibacteria group bacterium]
MPQEYETRILNIDRDEIIKKLEALGATLTKDVLQKRRTFDYPDGSLVAKNSWIRVRDTGDGKVWMAYKCHAPEQGNGVADCEEVEFEVESMDMATQFLLSVGFIQKSYQENKRTRYQLDDIQFDIDEWPLLPLFIEIESLSKERVLEGVKMLGYSETDTFQGHCGDIYHTHGIDWENYKIITFEKQEK